MLKMVNKLFLIILAVGGAIVFGASAILAANLLPNGAFESFQSYNGKDWRGFPEKYGQGWSLEVIDEDGLHFMDSDTFGQFAAATYGVPYNNYRLEGTYSQAFASRRGFNFVLSQTVSTGAGQDYAFGGKMVTYWKGPGGERDDTKIKKRIGLDMSGGTTYDGPNVIWTDWDSTDNAWISPALATTALGSQATVFVQVYNTGGDVGATALNSGHLDNFKFELAPVATLNLPATSPPGTLNVSWGVSLPDSGFWSLWGYDVEVKDNVNNSWQTVQTHGQAGGQNSSFNLNALAGRTYTVRVRPWQQRAPSGDSATTAMPGVWQEKSVLIGQAVTGQVMNHMGIGLSGVTVSISGAATSTVSNNGYYALPTGASGTFQVIANNSGDLVAPPAAAVFVPDGGVGKLDITLRPTGAAQAIQNNDFETDLSSWNVSNIGAAGVSGVDKHSGAGSLLISNTVGVSQTGTAIGMFNPLLFFWYKSDTAVTVEFLGDAAALGAASLEALNSKTLPVAIEWTHTTLEFAPGQVYTGTVGVNFKHGGGLANIFIDEVSIGAGPKKVFLPVMFKN